MPDERKPSDAKWFALLLLLVGAAIMGGFVAAMLCNSYG